MSVKDERRFGVLLEVAYDGSAFQGWAAQKKGRTVADALAGAVRTVDPRASEPRGASRTDAGVHAQCQLAAFDATREIAARGWVLACNQHLPDDACVRRARAIPAGYNPRYHALGKRYVYRVLLDRVRDPLLRDRTWRVGWPVDIHRMSREARSILGTHDFSAFRSAADVRKSAVRTITHVSVENESGDPRIVAITIAGNAFLYNMVRILVGTLMDVARGKLEEGTIGRALAAASEASASPSGHRARHRRLAGTTAPAQGLTLAEVMVELPEGSGEPWPR